MKSLREIQALQGAVFVEHYGVKAAGHYGDPLVEYHAIRGEVGAVDLCWLAKFVVKGRDRVRYLHNMLTNDIRNLRVWHGCYAALLTHQGKMESDLYVYAEPDDFRLECMPAGSKRLSESLNKYIVGDIVQIEDRNDAVGILSLQGPDSMRQMESTVGAFLEGLAPLEQRMIPKAPGNWTVVRRDRTGCDGYDLWLPIEEAAAVWDEWRRRGLPPAGYEALNWLRTEQGIPWYGEDMDEHSLPMEFGLDSAVSTTKGCYRGQEIVARVLNRGHLDRRFGAVSVSGPSAPYRGSEILQNDKKAGEVTSSVISPRLGHPLALAVLRSEVQEPGTAVDVRCADVVCPGEVIALPLHNHR
jgi:folate-binding protein YgfZ